MAETGAYAASPASPDPGKSPTWPLAEPSSTLCKGLARLRREGTLCDVAIVAGRGKGARRFLAHRNVLEARSDYFRARFEFKEEAEGRGKKRNDEEEEEEGKDDKVNREHSRNLSDANHNHYLVQVE